MDSQRSQPAPSPNCPALGQLLRNASLGPNIGLRQLQTVQKLWRNTPSVPLACNDPKDLAFDLESELGQPTAERTAGRLIEWIKQQLPEPTAEFELRRLAAPNLIRNAALITISSELCLRMSVFGGLANVSKTIVLDQGRISCGIGTGIIYHPIGVRLQISCGLDMIQTTPTSYTELLAEYRRF